MHPADHVVPDVHRVDAVRKHAHLEAIPETGCLERLIPPRRALDERVAHLLGSPRVDVIDDRFDRIRHGSRRIALLDAVSENPPLLELRRDRRRIISKLDLNESDTRIERARRKARSWQLDERMVLANRDCLGVCGGLVHVRTRRSIGGVREQGFDLGVLWEALCPGQRDHAAVCVKTVVSLTRVAQPPDDAVRVPQQERRRVDEHAVAFSDFDGESPQDRRCVRVRDGATLGRIRRQRAVTPVRFDHQHPWSDPLERDDARAAELAAIEPHGVRAETARKRFLVEDLGPEPRDLHQHPPVRIVPVERHEAVDLPEPGRL